jgi:hypothetical protein
MKSFNNFNELNWLLTYKSSNQVWLNDSLNWEKVSAIVTMDWTIPSFITQSTFINNHILFDTITRMSYLDVFLINSNLNLNKTSIFYLNIINDSFLHLITFFLPITPLLHSEYNETFSTTFLVAPELVTLFTDYISIYYFNNTFNFSVVQVFDSYTNNLNYFIGEGIITYLLFIVYIWFIIYCFLVSLLLKWVQPFGFQFLRFYYYFYSTAKDVRLQFETFLQIIVFLALYWSVVIFTFDDDQEEAIEFFDTVVFYVFSVLFIYFLYKYSIHYFAFLAASENSGRTVKFIALQFKADFLNSFSVLIRFYALFFRVNIYDFIEDVFDTYYIFIGDFDDDEYLNELFLSLHGTFLFTLDNLDDRSFLYEDENDFTNDLFFMYFIVWGKFTYFFIYLLEIVPRISLGFFIFYLVIFEIHGVNQSYKEDSYFSNKRI